MQTGKSYGEFRLQEHCCQVNRRESGTYGSVIHTQLYSPSKAAIIKKQSKQRKRSESVISYHRTKLKRKENQTKTTESPTVSSRGPWADNSYTVLYNHDRLIIVKWRPEKYSLQLATERCQQRCIADRRRQAIPRTCRSHWEVTVHRVLNV